MASDTCLCTALLANCSTSVRAFQSRARAKWGQIYFLYFKRLLLADSVEKVGLGYHDVKVGA
ncbi:hypothetical protein FBY03_112126 [Pseudomonas sp. SJZ079]|nr:hypothetical protein FBY03_112126 [Pseudomonas sp. SJZ079]